MEKNHNKKIPNTVRKQILHFRLWGLLYCFFILLILTIVFESRQPISGSVAIFGVVLLTLSSYMAVILFKAAQKLKSRESDAITFGLKIAKIFNYKNPFVARKFSENLTSLEVHDWIESKNVEL